MVGVRQFDEEDAIEKALELFWKKGLSETSMQDLAEATGVQRGSLYNAYGTKDALFLRAYAAYADSFLKQARFALDAPTLQKSLSRLFDFIIDSALTGEPARGCLTTKAALEGESIGDSIRASLQHLLDSLEDMVRRRLSIPDEACMLALPAKQSAALVVAHTRGIVVIERVYGDRARMRATANSLIKLLVVCK